MRDERDDFQRLVDAHYQPVFRLAYVLLRNRSLAEEACQDVFMRAWVHRRTLNSDNGAASWLFTTARRAAVDQLRRGKRWKVWLERTAVSQASTATGDDHQPHDDSALLQDLIQLPEEERLVVLLRILEGLAGHEVARRLGISQATVSRRLHDGLGELSERLQRRAASEEKHDPR